MRDAVVVPVEEPGGVGRRLVAYVVSGAREPHGRTRTARFLAEIIPEHMVPSAFVVLDELPLSSNGKVDRRRLPSPDPARIDGERVTRARERRRKRQLVAIFADLLGHDRVGVDDDFFELGGHSLLAMQAVSRARRALGVELPLTSLFETATAAGLAEGPSRVRAGQATANRPWPPLPVPRGGAFPLLFSQLAYWEAHRNYPGNACANPSRAYRLRGPLVRGSSGGSTPGAARAA